jgi:phosphoglycerol transferase
LAGRFGCTRKGWASLAIAVAVACSGVYYGFFACFFLLTAGLAASWRKGRWLPGKAALLLIVVVTATTLLNYLPQFVYNRENGPNREAAARSTSDAEHFALRMSQMVLPTSGHRVPLLNFAKQRFNAKITQVTESDMAALGVLGTAGLLYLLALLLVRPVEPGEDSRQKDLHAVSILTVTAILVGSMGGFSLLIASVFPHIRCYNRLSVYIAFFCLFALAHLLQRLCERLPNRPGGRAAGALLCVGLAVLGAWEQTPAETSVISTAAADAFASDRDFVHQLEDRLPAGSTIFQMPYSTFPEGRGYEHLRLYLHSHSLKWSFGAMRGRYADLWQRHVVGQPIEEMASTLAWSGFAGVCWDRQASSPAESDLESRLRALLGEPVLLGADSRVAFYSLQRHAAKLRESTSPERAQQCRQEALHPVLVCWGPGFQQVEDPRRFGGRWSNARGELMVFNPGDAPRSLRLELTVRTAQAGPATLQLQGPGLQQEDAVAGEPRAVQAQLIVPPGRSIVRFHCDGAVHPEHERRVFQVVDYTVKVAPSPASRSTIARSR